MTTEKKKLEGVSLDALMIDSKAVENGDWVKEIDGAPGAQVHTKGWNCAESMALRAELISARPPHLIEGSDEYEEAKKADPGGHAQQMTEVNRRERGEVLKVIVMDWKGLGGIPFNSQNLNTVCEKDEFIPMRNILMNAALTVGDMRKRREDEQVKNFAVGLGISFDSAA